MDYEKGKDEEAKLTYEAGRTEEEGRVTDHDTNGRHRGILLMMCQVVIRGPKGCSTQARALLHLRLEASFITERPAQQLRLPRHRQGPAVSCIGGSTPQIRSKGTAGVQITDTSQEGRVHPVEALVLPKITSNTPAYPVSLQGKSKHLSEVSLAYPEYGTTGAVDVLLGADIFSRIGLHGRHFGPVGAPSLLRPS